MKPRSRSRHEQDLEDNAAILSRFNWSTSQGYKKCMVLVFMFLIFLFLFRGPIIKWINKLPDPPVIDIGHCEAKGDLEIGQVHITPSTSSEGVIISFSTNVETNNMISVQYGTDRAMTFETFAYAHKISTEGQSRYPYIHYAYFLILSPGHKYYYRISCGDIHSQTYSFIAWRSGNGWSPTIAVVGGALTPPLIDKLSHQTSKLSLVLHNAETGTLNSDSYFEKAGDLVAKVPYIVLPYKDQGSTRDYQFPLPQGGWPVEKPVFHTVLGPAIVIGLNSGLKDVAMLAPALEKELQSTTRLRSMFPWLIVLARDMEYCNINSETCSQVHTQLFTKYQVDLFITMKSIASIFASVSESHQAPSGRLRFTNSTADVFELLTINFDRPDKLCVDVEYPSSKSDHPHSNDHLCYHKEVHLDHFKSSGLSSEPEVSYDFTAWLAMVIILSVVLAFALIFHKYLYSKTCRYMESGGGVPLYTGKLLSV